MLRLKKIELLCVGIKHACPEANLPSDCHELIDNIACKPITPACIDGSCQDCLTIDLECINDCDSIMYYKWAKNNKYYEKPLFILTGLEASDLLEEQITYLHAYYYQICVQSKEYTRQVHELSEGEMVVHVDYSESYKNYGCRQKSVYVRGTLKVHYVDRFVSTDSVVMKFSFSSSLEDDL